MSLLQKKIAKQAKIASEINFKMLLCLCNIRRGFAVLFLHEICGPSFVLRCCHNESIISGSHFNLRNVLIQMRANFKVYLNVKLIPY